MDPSELPAPSRPTKVVEDPATLKALAHPLRMRMLGRLRLHGPATASELGRVFGESSGSTSYHLRQLERYGFVEPAAEQPTRREKVWRSSHQSTSIRLRDPDDPGSQAARDTVLQVQLDHLLEGVRRRQREAGHWPVEWQDAHTSSDFSFRITASGLARLKHEVFQLIETYETPQDPDARLVAVHLHSFPEEGERQ